MSESYRELQRALMENPEVGDLIPGTGGFRKVRWLSVAQRPGRGTDCDGKEVSRYAGETQ
jgi:hypothetical protein